MLVLSLTDCPPALRGDLSRWLLEIDTGVYVGQVSQRVREELWARVIGHVNDGRAIMVFRANNEQRMDFRIHNAHWEPIDFDGLKLMLRPGSVRRAQAGASNANPAQPIQEGYSMAAKMRMAKRMQKARAQPVGLPEHLVIIDLETSGLKPDLHEIIELGAIRINQGEEVDSFQALIKPQQPLPEAVAQLTGLSHQQLKDQGLPIQEALPAFLSFLSSHPIVAHNIAFDLAFLREACAQNGLSFPGNRRIDTLALSERHVKDAPDHKLTTLMEHFELPYPDRHRSLADCRATLLLLHKLIEIRQTTE